MKSACLDLVRDEFNARCRTLNSHLASLDDVRISQPDAWTARLHVLLANGATFELDIELLDIAAAHGWLTTPERLH